MSDRIAHRLLVERKFNGLSQKELAERAGVSVRTINSIENGGDSNLSVIHKIEEALKTKLY